MACNVALFAAAVLLQFAGLAGVKISEGAPGFSADECIARPDFCDDFFALTTEKITPMRQPPTSTREPAKATTQQRFPIHKAWASLEEEIHSYADKNVSQETLKDLMAKVNIIVTEGLRSSVEDTTVLQDVENIIRNADIRTELPLNIEDLGKVSVAIEETEGNANSVISFKKFEDHSDRNKSWSINILSDSASDENLGREDNEVSVMFPAMNASTRLTVMVYNEPKSLLQEKYTKNRRRLSSAVVNVNAYNNLRESVQPRYVDIVFKKKMDLRGCEKYVCEYWNHSGTDEGMWSTDGCKVEHATGDKVFCRCSHLTHFGVLVQEMPLELGPLHVWALDAITYLGCTMSLLGVARIAVVAATKPRWRRNTGHKLVLCLAVNVALMTALFLSVAIGAASSGAACVGIGAILHYLLLSSFMWTLVSAWLQYRRYVVGIYTPLTHLVLKMSLLSWALPIFPVAVLLCIDPAIYTNDDISCHERTLCFPTDVYFNVTVVGPVGLIVLANAFIFIRIIHTFYGCDRKVNPIRGGSKSTRVLVMVVFEFFLLGLPWAFGFMSKWHITFLYLFCLTATQHGFILFLFFVFLKKREGVKQSEVSGGTACANDLGTYRKPQRAF